MTPSQDDFQGQFKLLEANRNTLSHYLLQQATSGSANSKPEVSNGIYHARQDIRRIKNILRSWGGQVEDHPFDEETDFKKSSESTTYNLNIRNKRLGDEKYAPTILIIDDNQAFLKMTTYYLCEESGENYRVLLADSGIEGLKIATNEQPDLIILDIQMSVMDGYTVLREIGIRKIPTRVIICSGYTIASSIGMFIEAGACDLLEKPFESSQLLSKVKRSLEIDPTLDIVLQDRQRLINPVLARLSESQQKIRELQEQMYLLKSRHEQILEHVENYFDQLKHIVSAKGGWRKTNTIIKEFLSYLETVFVKKED